MKSERQRGITISFINKPNAFKHFSTKKRSFTIIDTPGHRDFMKTAIRGISVSDAAILMVAAPPGEFEAGISTDRYWYGGTY